MRYLGCAQVRPQDAYARLGFKRIIFALCVVASCLVPFGALNPSSALATDRPSISSVTSVSLDEAIVFSFSSTGQYVLAYANDQICLFTIPDGEPIPGTCSTDVIRVDGQHIAWSPDGQRAAVTENSAQTLNDSDLWLFDAAQGTVTDLTDDHFDGGLFDIDEAPNPNAVFFDNTPAWSPDGRSIAFGRTVMSDGAKRTDIDTVDLQTGEVSTATSFKDAGFATWGGVVWSDAAHLWVSIDAANTTYPDNGIWSIDVTTGMRTRIYDPATTGKTASVIAAVTPTQALLAFPQTFQEPPTVRVDCPYALLNLPGGDLQPLKLDAEGACAGAVGVAPDHDRLIATSVDPVTDEISVSLIDPKSGEGQPIDPAPVVAKAGDKHLWAYGQWGLPVPTIPWVGATMLIVMTDPSSWLALELSNI